MPSRIDISIDELPLTAAGKLLFEFIWFDFSANELFAC